MRRILNSSEEIAICGENHFLGHLIRSEGVRQKLRRFGDLRRDDAARRAVDAIYTGRLAGRSRTDQKAHWRWIVKNVPREELLAKVLESDRSERALFQIIMEVYADHRNRPGIGEKTPAHVRYVPTIIDWFPEARIIHMVRDPRAIFVSELRRRSEKPITPPYRQLSRWPAILRLGVLLQTTVTWFDSIRRLSRHRRLYPSNYLAVRFEDLVLEPEKSIRQVCEFVGITFRREMLEQVVVSRGFASGQPGFDSAAADRWRQYIDSWSKAWLGACFKPQLRRLGYEA